MSKRHYCKYGHLWKGGSSDFQRLLSELRSKERLKRNRLREISEETGIGYKTLESWRRHLQEDPFWHPEYGHPKGPVVLSKEAEADVVEVLEREYLDVKRFCPRQVVTRALTAKGREVHGDQFHAGRTLVRNFMERANLSMRTPHLRRRTGHDDAAVSSFLARIDLVLMQFPPSLVFNVDETPTRLINGTLKTLARTGAEEVQVMTKATKKTDVTAIACCSLDGARLPLWVLAKGKTRQCEDKFRNAEQLQSVIDHKIFVDHSPTGWSTADVMMRYLTWLKERTKGRLIHVIWDLHSSHRDQRVQEWAAASEIGLTFIPAGQTDTWQPLDRKIFGSLKQRAVLELHNQMIDRDLADCDINDAIKILVDSWDKVSEEEITEAWQPLVV